jgi:FtsP/CotA-like multicopper oxidase with cupredoxin domain
MISRRSVLAGITASVSSTSMPAQGQSTTQPIVLTAAPAKARLRTDPATESDIWAYNGGLPNPVLRLKRGQSSTIRLVNTLPQPTSLHIRGLRHANAFDGVTGLTQAPIEPGRSFDYRITPQDSGAFIYHPMIPGRTSEQMDRGLCGMLIVEEDGFDAAVDADIAVLLDDWRLTEAHQIDGNMGIAADNARLGRLGNALTVNGKAGPEEIKARPGARVRLRIGGAMNARILPMRFEKMVKATVLAIDGQPCDPFDPLRKQVIIAPGSRYDVILDLPDKAGEETLVVVALGDGMTVVRFVTEGEKLAGKPPVPALPANPALPAGIRLQEARRAEFSIAGGWDIKDPAGPGATREIIAKAFPDAAKVWTLNHGFPAGLAGKPIFSARKGNVVVVALVNRTAWTQVITLHGHVFRVLHGMDDGWEPFFLDTVIVPEGRTIRIAFVADNPGKWLIRSAIIEHMESGVLSWFEVLA